ncbi:molybdopterin-dependent oxidoreductase [Desulfovibrio ferrophilus]|uniref:Molybdopterin oxidoreductase n=1 Tax=Desulfovibrio ferrophilus TaxID=241368 RepID=A0A2Z6B064_9BACT|nr:molybdopterin-dependent oxidoreductase [Desulfovibrio ferrophilus]BBD08917.1 molybdopterin oxidoreductase [Desulfovibrio ferrophilus]
MSTTEFVSACTRDCPDCCSIVVTKNEDGSCSFKGNPEHPFTKGFICAKTAKYPQMLTHPERITQPLVRSGAGYWPVTWDEALDLVTRRIDKLRNKPERILHMKGHGYRGVLAGVSNWFFGRLGSSTLSGSPCDEAGIVASEADFGVLDTNHPEDLQNASRIVNWGRDFSRFSVHQAAIVKAARKAGTKVLTISPAYGGNEGFSDEIVLIRPGTDRFLAAALCKGLLTRGVAAEIRDAAANLSTLESLVVGMETNDLLEACGVSRADFEMVLDWYTADGPTASVIGWGLQRYLHGGENVRWIDAVVMLSGNVGIAGGGAHYNISSGRNFSKWSDDGAADKPRRTLPVHNIGRAIMRAEPPIEMIWVDGGNFINQMPAGDVMVEAFGRCEFVVAVDTFFTDTALRADLILPCALMTEREDVLGSCLHDWVAHSAKVQDPPGEVRNDWDILEDLGKRLAEPVLLPDREETLARGLQTPNLKVTLDELRAKGFAKADWPVVAFENLEFGHADGKFRFVEELSPEPEEPAEYPLNLLTLISRKTIHSQLPPGDEGEGLPEVYISSQSPMLEKVDRDKPVFVVSQRGRIEVRLVLDDTVHPEAVVVRRGGWMRYGKGLNPLVVPAETDMGGGTAYYSQRVRLES